MDHQGSPDPESNQSHIAAKEDEASESENKPIKNSGKSSSSRSKLFSFSVVNSYGTANISSLPCEGNNLKLTRNYHLSMCTAPIFLDWFKKTNCGRFVSAAHSTLAIDWDSDTKKLCYDEQEAEVSTGLLHI